VTLGLVLAYFENHLTPQNKAAVIKLFEELTGKVLFVRTWCNNCNRRRI
jgi:hypothetical protein